MKKENKKNKNEEDEDVRLKRGTAEKGVAFDADLIRRVPTNDIKSVDRLNTADEL